MYRHLRNRAHRCQQQAQKQQQHQLSAAAASSSQSSIVHQSNQAQQQGEPAIIVTQHQQQLQQTYGTVNVPSVTVSNLPMTVQFSDIESQQPSQSQQFYSAHAQMNICTYGVPPMGPAFYSAGIQQAPQTQSSQPPSTQQATQVTPVATGSSPPPSHQQHQSQNAEQNLRSIDNNGYPTCDQHMMMPPPITPASQSQQMNGGNSSTRLMTIMGPPAMMMTNVPVNSLMMMRSSRGQMRQNATGTMIAATKMMMKNSSSHLSRRQARYFHNRGRHFYRPYGGDNNSGGEQQHLKSSSRQRRASGGSRDQNGQSRENSRENNCGRSGQKIGINASTIRATIKAPSNTTQFIMNDHCLAEPDFDHIHHAIMAHYERRRKRKLLRQQQQECREKFKLLDTHKELILKDVDSIDADVGLNDVDEVKDEKIINHNKVNEIQGRKIKCLTTSLYGPRYKFHIRDGKHPIKNDVKTNVSELDKDCENDENFSLNPSAYNKLVPVTDGEDRKEASQNQIAQGHGLAATSSSTTTTPSHICHISSLRGSTRSLNDDDSSTISAIYSGESPHIEHDYLQREFQEVYDTIHTERLSSMSKNQLVNEYLILEERVEELESKLREAQRLILMVKCG